MATPPGSWVAAKKEWRMADGKNCPDCDKPMQVESEKQCPAGNEVVYSSECGFKEKTFEDK